MNGPVWLAVFTGLALFLFAMQQLEQSLHGLLGSRALRWLRQATATPWKGALAGTLITAMLQSSSLVGLVLLALVSTGLVSLRGGMAIMLGANLGTTLTGWLVTLVGFQLPLESAALPLAALGGLLWVFLPVGRGRGAGLFLFAIGLLLFGLGTMKGAVEGIGARFDTAWLSGYPAWVWLIAGVLLTAVIQSSSATMLIALSALHGGLVGLPQALAVVIGADLGTTTTLVLGAIKGAPVKRQVAAFHVLYNLITDMLAFLLLRPVWPAVMQGLGVSDPLYALVAFHSTFNFFGIFLFMPLLPAVERLLRRFVGRHADPDAVFLEPIPEGGVEPALMLARQGAQRLREDIRQRGQAVSGVRSLEAFYSDYALLTDREMRLSAWLSRLDRGALSADQEARLQALRDALSESVYAFKALKDVVDDLVLLRDSGSRELVLVAGEIDHYLRGLFVADQDATLDEAAHHRAMEMLHQHVHEHIEEAREAGVSVLNLARGVDECGRHWLRGRAAWNGSPVVAAA